MITVENDDMKKIDRTIVGVSSNCYWATQLEMHDEKDRAVNIALPLYI